MGKFMYIMSKENTNWVEKLRIFYTEYRSEFIFGALLTGMVVLSYALSPLIPEKIFRRYLSPAMNCAIFVSCALGAWTLFRHHQGMRIRLMSAVTMVVWAVLTFIAMLFKATMHNNSLDAATGLLSMDGWEFVVGNILGWLLLIYPTELLRPGWLNFKRSVLQLLPVLIVGLLDGLLDTDLRWLLAAYPFVLLAYIGSNIRAYRNYCEENYSSMEDIDAQWIVRYLIMIIILGASYFFLSIAHFPTRLFTQQWLLFFIITYSNEQILFRPDPWRDVQKNNVQWEQESNAAEQPLMVQQPDDAASIIGQSESVQLLEQWMETEKPYLNKDFRLTDMMKILPMNRTYLSQLINNEFGCNFYQYVTTYRIKEAKRLMRANPTAKMQQIAEQSGFSSATVFGRVFARETGMTPSEWCAQSDNS